MIFINYYYYYLCESANGKAVYTSNCRSARETTPCSLIRNSETIGTPGSTTRVSNSGVSSRRILNSSRRNYPTTHEMEEFFARAEELQQRVFMEKYTLHNNPNIILYLLDSRCLRKDCIILIPETFCLFFLLTFLCRYNFDPVNDLPLPGRYEWVKLDAWRIKIMSSRIHIISCNFSINLCPVFSWRVGLQMRANNDGGVVGRPTCQILML